MTLEKLTPGERFIVEWQFGICGDFKRNLAEAMTTADTVNLNKMRAGFPDEVDAYINYGQTRGWWEDVRTKAGI